MLLIRILFMTVFLFPAPVLLGIPWTMLLPNKNRYRLSACFPIGFFVELAIFQLLEVPIAILHLPFMLLCWVFVAFVASVCFFGAVFYRRYSPFKIMLPELNKWETFYSVVALGLLGLQLYNGFVRDTTYWSYDDAVYVTYAADAIRYNAISTINPYTGIATTFNAHRAVQGWLYFPAFLSKLSSLPVTVVERTVLETYFIFLAYTVYWYMACVLFAQKDNRLIFLIILSVLHIFGLYSQYSVTFRLLGPNYQGKAVLSISFFPLLFTFLIQILNRAYSRMIGLLLLLFSVAASSLTMFGAVTMMMNTTLVVCVSTVSGKMRAKYMKHMRYIPWACLFPALYCGVYFIYNFGQF